MPTSKQAKKRVRQNEKRRLRHKGRRTELRTIQKTFLTAVTEKDAAKAAAQMAALQTKLDKAASFHSLHPNTAARRKSRLQRKLNKLASGGSVGAAPAGNSSPPK